MEVKYPKEDPEYKKRVMKAFYNKIKNTKWDAVDENEYKGKPRGRKAKVTERIPAKLRPSEEKYKWF